MLKTRRATLDDVPIIARLHVSSWRATYTGILPEPFLDLLSEERNGDFWKGAMAEPSTQVWLLEEAVAAIGFAAFGPPLDLNVKGGTELYSLYLAPGHFDQGKGSFFWRRLESKMKSENVFLWVVAENVRAKRFYAKHGFRRDPKQEKELEIHGSSITKQLYRKHL